MDKNFKRRWIRALLSGKYKQGRGSLKTKYGNFCCLGVACDLLDPSGWNGRSHVFSTEDLSYLSELAIAKIGLAYSEQSELVKLNDKKSSSFKKIAALIKENL